MALVLGYCLLGCSRMRAPSRVVSSVTRERHRRSMPLHVTAVRMMILVGLRSCRLVKAAFAHSALRCICDCVTASPHCTHSLSRTPAPTPDEEEERV